MLAPTPRKKTVFLPRDPELEAARLRVKAALTRATNPDSRIFRVVQSAKTRLGIAAYSETELDPNDTVPPDYAQPA